MALLTVFSATPTESPVPGGLVEAGEGILVTHVQSPDGTIYPLRPEDRAPNPELTGKVWDLDDEGFAVPSDPVPEPQEKAAPARRRK